MKKPLVSDELWANIESLLPSIPSGPKGGRPRVADRVALTGIIVVLRSGMPCELLPQDMGCGSGVTCWRRLRDGQEAGFWDRLHQTLLDRLGLPDLSPSPHIWAVVISVHPDMQDQRREKKARDEQERVAMEAIRNTRPRTHRPRPGGEADL